MFKGLVGETMGSLAHKVMLDQSIYHELNNITIPTPNGTTQIDHVIVSQYGIFVIEAKNMNGWIFGDTRAAQWTQSLPGNNKFRFQNPLMQNYRHTKCLSDFLKIEHDKFHSLVMFWGESKFKSPMPSNVIDSGYSAYIKSKKTVLFSNNEIQQIITAIQTGRLPATWATRKQHLTSLNERHYVSPDNTSKTLCPKCKSEMIKRIGKTGSFAGKSFWGCSKFPACRGIVNI